MHGARLLAACRPKVRPVAIDLAWLGGAIGFCLASSYNAPLRDSAEPRQSCQIARDARALSLVCSGEPKNFPAAQSVQTAAPAASVLGGKRKKEVLELSLARTGRT